MFVLRTIDGLYYCGDETPSRKRTGEKGAIHFTTAAEARTQRDVLRAGGWWPLCDFKVYRITVD